MDALRLCGFLRADTDFSRGLDGGQPLLKLLRCQWDRRIGRGHPAAIAPGLFIGHRFGLCVSITEIAALLEVSSLPALQQLAGVLDSRLEHGDLSVRVMMWRFCTPDSHVALLRDLASTANLEGFEGMAAADLVQASHKSLTLLERFLRERNTLAPLITREACPQGSKQDGSHQHDSFVQMLAAVCSMAGAEGGH